MGSSNRSAIKAKYDIHTGDCGGGFLEWWCYPCCAVVQERREVKYQNAIGFKNRSSANNTTSSANNTTSIMQQPMPMEQPQYPYPYPYPYPMTMPSIPQQPSFQYPTRNSLPVIMPYAPPAYDSEVLQHERAPPPRPPVRASQASLFK